MIMHNNPERVPSLENGKNASSGVSDIAESNSIILLDSSAIQTRRAEHPFKTARRISRIDYARLQAEQEYLEYLAREADRGKILISSEVFAELCDKRHMIPRVAGHFISEIRERAVAKHVDSDEMSQLMTYQMAIGDYLFAFEKLIKMLARRTFRAERENFGSSIEAIKSNAYHALKELAVVSRGIFLRMKEQSGKLGKWDQLNLMNVRYSNGHEADESLMALAIYNAILGNRQAAILTEDRDIGALSTPMMAGIITYRHKYPKCYERIMANPVRVYCSFNSDHYKLHSDSRFTNEAQARDFMLSFRKMKARDLVEKTYQGIEDIVCAQEASLSA